MRLATTYLPIVSGHFHPWFISRIGRPRTALCDHTTTFNLAFRGLSLAQWYLAKEGTAWKKVVKKGSLGKEATTKGDFSYRKMPHAKLLAMQFWMKRNSELFWIDQSNHQRTYTDLSDHEGGALNLSHMLTSSRDATFETEPQWRPARVKPYSLSCCCCFHIVSVATVTQDNGTVLTIWLNLHSCHNERSNCCFLTFVSRPLLAAV